MECFLVQTNYTMKTRFNVFRRAGVFYTATSRQTSLHTKDETETGIPVNARNEATRQPVLNQHLARAYPLAFTFNTGTPFPRG